MASDSRGHSTDVPAPCGPAAIRIHPDIRSMPAGSGCVLLDLTSDRYYTLNPTAAAVWRVLAGGGTPDDATRALCDEFDVTAADAADSVRSFVDELVRERLALVVDGQPLAPKENSHGQAKA